METPPSTTFEKVSSLEINSSLTGFGQPRQTARKRSKRFLAQKGSWGDLRLRRCLRTRETRRNATRRSALRENDAGTLFPISQGIFVLTLRRLERLRGGSIMRKSPLSGRDPNLLPDVTPIYCRTTRWHQVSAALRLYNNPSQYAPAMSRGVPSSG